MPKDVFDRRSSGILLHVTSLPGPHGSGDLGPEAHAFVDALARAKQSWWQMLPVGPIGWGNSPYQSSSAVAGNPLLVSLQTLKTWGLLRASEVKPHSAFKATRVNYAAAEAYRTERLGWAFARFEESASADLRRGFENFRRRQRAWLQDFCLFSVIKDLHAGAAWNTWEGPLRRRAAGALEKVRRAQAKRMRYYQFVQYAFDRQWRALQERARAKGVGLVGDLPIFVAHDSADVWAHQKRFSLDKAGKPDVVAGVPPDYFSEDGQKWGNPVYRWEYMRRDGYSWWALRLKVMLQRFDVVRLDHFIGFHRTWQIPAEGSARYGRYHPGPGLHFFDAMRAQLGPLPVIAEDLGVVTPEVVALREACGFPGMQVMQFSFEPSARGMQHRPHCYPRRCVAYTGTHDNNTVQGWLREELIRRPQELQSVLDYVGACDLGQMHWYVIHTAMQSPANWVIIPLQDVLGADEGARMNFPGTVGGNWEWRYAKSQLKRGMLKRLEEWTRIFGRAPQEGGWKG